MRLHEALAKLAPTKGDGYLKRGARVVRNAVGPVEQAHHRYVTEGEGGAVEAFDATTEDHAADDWALGSRKADAERAKAEAEAVERAKADAEAKARAKATKSDKE